MNKHWAFKYIGLKYLPGGRSFATGVDCWGFVMLAYRDEFNIPLPNFPGISSQNTQRYHAQIQLEKEHNWTREDQPFEGCLVAMSQSIGIHHVGLYTEANGGRVVHCWDKQNVIVETLAALRLKGFRTIQFYRHRLWEQPTL